jgi:hypothetical protein
VNRCPAGFVLFLFLPTRDVLYVIKIYLQMKPHLMQMSNDKSLLLLSLQWRNLSSGLQLKIIIISRLRKQISWLARKCLILSKTIIQCGPFLLAVSQDKNQVTCISHTTLRTCLPLSPSVLRNDSRIWTFYIHGLGYLVL